MTQRPSRKQPYTRLQQAEEEDEDQIDQEDNPQHKRDQEKQPFIHYKEKEDLTKHRDEQDIRYRDKIGKPPLASICFAIVLNMFGLLLLVGGIAFLSGYVETDYWRRGFIFVGVGITLLIPGIYVLFIAVNVMLGRPGYTYAMIPD